MLEAEGWIVWWDDKLTAGQEFRDDIGNHIDQSKVVVVLWTENSVNSRWVRAEANRALQDNKLVCTRADDLDLRQIPLPFGEEHSVLISQHEKIRAAIRKVSERIPPAPRTWKKVRFEVLSWGAVIAAVSTLTANLEGLIRFSLLTRLLVENWVAVLGFAWSKMLFFLPKVAETDAVVLSALSFTASTLFLAPTVDVARQRSWIGSATGTAVSFAILLLVFAIGLFSSVTFGKEQGQLYWLTHQLLSVAGVEFLRLNSLQQAYLMFLTVMLTVSVVLAGIAMTGVIASRGKVVTHEANVGATAYRLHRIVIGIGIVLALNEIARALEASAPGLRTLIRSALLFIPYFSESLSAVLR